MHLAETKEQARADVAYGIVPFSKYFTHVLPAGPTRGDTPEEIIANVDEDGFAVIGTPDDAIAKIESLVDESGGFGTFLLFGHDWASPAATKHSFELFAQYVMPHFTGQLERPAGVVRLGHRQRRRVREPRDRRDHEGDHRSRRPSNRRPADAVTCTPTSHDFDADGIRLVVHDWGGDGAPVLLAHPTGFHGRVWEPVARAARRARAATSGRSTSAVTATATRPTPTTRGTASPTTCSRSPSTSASPATRRSSRAVTRRAAPR